MATEPRTELNITDDPLEQDNALSVQIFTELNGIPLDVSKSQPTNTRGHSVASQATDDDDKPMTLVTSEAVYPSQRTKSVFKQQSVTDFQEHHEYKKKRDQELAPSNQAKVFSESVNPDNSTCAQLGKHGQCKQHVEETVPSRDSMQGLATSLSKKEQISSQRKKGIKRADFKCFQTRKESFRTNNWPADKPLPDDMAAAGFFFLGPQTVGEQLYVDMVWCYKCGKSVFGWEKTDNPVKEHEKRNKNCK